MTLRWAVLAVLVLGLLGGCAAPPIKPIDVSDSIFSAKAEKIGVAVSVMPKVDTQFPGAGCLLCLATASLNHTKLTAHVQTLPTEDLAKVKDELILLLLAKGLTAIAIEAPLDLDKLGESNRKSDTAARRDFTPLKSKLGVDKLLVVEVNALGVWRNYASYVPVDDPKAVFIGSGYLVNLSSNMLEWYRPVSIMKGADQKWDEPTTFPGLTNAYFQAIELGKDELTQPFTK
ncbi:MAG: hypothetical protein RL375_3009 [Pseudomonadota bacterium]|jgi:hypothetical protein